ncbi:hypothetical protein C8A00DRAFT_36179 [Chaetomidium leptoderma]|uniref:Uncharacterized protein n=1 Tax=Chaetomidium leptoderma TaxID=669021 RepID=A0AAN6VGR9_9PEZI|nr:hypothetical protein C8A00DRAFT_36179 [Chaetomidium leptoderma]
MAPTSKSGFSFRRPSTRTNGSEHDRVVSWTTTRPVVPRPNSQGPSDLKLPRTKNANRDAGPPPPPPPPPPAPRSWHRDPYVEPGGLPNSTNRSRTRNTTLDSIGLSEEHSATSSPEDSDISESNNADTHDSPSEAPTRSRVPPRQWNPPAGGAGGRPPTHNSRDAGLAYAESESEDSDGAARSLPGNGGQRHELQNTIESKQRLLGQLKHETASKRNEMEDFSRQRDTIDNAFMQILRHHLASNGRVAFISMDVLGEKVRELQVIRDKYYEAKSEYELLESKLDTARAELERLKTGWVDMGPGAPLLPPPPPPPPPPPNTKAPGIVEMEEQDGSRDEHDSAPPTPVGLLGISGHLREDIHPVYDDLLEAAGDRQLAKEHVEDLEMHREKILYDLEIELHRKRVREDQGNLISEEGLRSLRSSLATVPTDAAEFEAHFGIAITDDELEFLRDYETVSQRAREKLDSTTETLDYFRALCLKKGVMRKHASYHEELAIFSSAPGWLPSPQDGNITIDPPPPPRYPPSHTTNNPPPPPSLAHPRFPILLSNPTHVLALLSPLQALERALRRPKDDPSGALRRAECMKELGISTLMTKAENTPDFINQWLIHRLRTSPLEAELMLAVCEGVFRVVNLRRWQEEVLYYWRLDEAAKLEVGLFEGAVTPRHPWGAGGGRGGEQQDQDRDGGGGGGGAGFDRGAAGAAGSRKLTSSPSSSSSSSSAPSLAGVTNSVRTWSDSGHEYVGGGDKASSVLEGDGEGEDKVNTVIEAEAEGDGQENSVIGAEDNLNPVIEGGDKVDSVITGDGKANSVIKGEDKVNSVTTVDGRPRSEPVVKKARVWLWPW